MFSGRKKSRFSVIDPFKRRTRQNIHLFRIIQAVISFVVLVLFYFIPPGYRNDVVMETCYPTVFMLLFFRVLTSPTAKVSFYYNLYVNTLSVGLYTVVGTNDLYLGLVKRPAPYNVYFHYARLYLMLVCCFFIMGDVLYSEFFDKNIRILPEKMSVGDAMRAKIEIAVKKYNEDIAKREKEEMEKAGKTEKAEKDGRESQKEATIAASSEVVDDQPSTSNKKSSKWF